MFLYHGGTPYIDVLIDAFVGGTLSLKVEGSEVSDLQRWIVCPIRDAKENLTSMVNLPFHYYYKAFSSSDFGISFLKYLL